MYTFTYQKNITLYTVLLVFEIIDSLQCILKEPTCENFDIFVSNILQPNYHIETLK